MKLNKILATCAALVAASGAFAANPITLKVGDNWGNTHPMAAALDTVFKPMIEKGSNARLATSITEQAGIRTNVEWDPMAYDWPASMRKIAETLHQALN